MRSLTFTPAELADYQRDGFVLKRGLFDGQEMEILLDFARRDPTLQTSAYGRKDATGTETKIALFNAWGDDLYSMFARSPCIVNRLEQLLGDEVYLWHMKMNMKEPRVGGAWEWHQDYGYWYHNGCLYPQLASCLIAVTPSSKENGCLEVLRGSHHLGRIDHGRTGDQIGADMERVNQALERHERVYVETDPGDSLFFDGNLLHASAQNKSDHPRWSLICCYNTKRNNPYKESKHPFYSPLAKVGDDAIKTWRA